MDTSGEWEALLNPDTNSSGKYQSSRSGSGSDVLTMELMGGALPVPWSEAVPSEAVPSEVARAGAGAGPAAAASAAAAAGGASRSVVPSELPAAPISRDAAKAPRKMPSRDRASAHSGNSGDPVSLTPPPKQSAPSPHNSPNRHRRAASARSFASIPVSLPCYNRSSCSQSVTTANMFAAEAQQTQPRRQESVANLSKTLNQVPQRFSRFLVDSGGTAATPAHTRDISQSMGSQATIFSTRPENTPQKTRSKKRSARAGVEEGVGGGLRRRDALRSREGSSTYRVRLRLRKMASRLKNRWARVRRFFAPRKRASASVSRRPTRRASARGRPVISAPVTNPAMGSGAQRVEELTPQLKLMAGGPADEHRGKLSHLSQYIQEQRQLSHPVASAVYSVESVAPAPPPHRDSSFQQHVGLRPRDGAIAEEREPAANMRHDVSDLAVQMVWKQYLSNVLASRIRLRQEIHLFQALLAEQVPLAGLHARHPSSAYSAGTRPTNDLLSHRASIVNYSAVESAASVLSKPTASVASTAKSSADASSVYDTDDESVDENVQKLQTVLNRRSMLGDMLDYDSDRDSVTSSSTVSNSASDTRSDGSLLKRYGTVKRSMARSSLSRSSTVDAAMPRSRGISCGLHQIAH